MTQRNIPEKWKPELHRSERLEIRNVLNTKNFNSPFLNLQPGEILKNDGVELDASVAKFFAS